jgi:hypothetical protein
MKQTCPHNKEADASRQQSKQKAWLWIRCDIEDRVFKWTSELCVETRIDSTRPCVRSVISSCTREQVEVARVLEF